VSTQTDFLALEQLIIERVEGTLKYQGKPVTCVSKRNAPGENQTGGRAPRVELTYDNYSVINSESESSTVIVQTWTACLCLANVRDAARSGAREDGGPLLLQLLQLLLGWRPPAAVDGERVFDALKLAQPTFRPTYLDTVSYFPLTFTTRLPVQGTGA
jgi:hypothetical protein